MINYDLTKTINLSRSYLDQIKEELNDLLLYLHKDDSTGELERVTERFEGKAILDSLPALSQLDLELDFQEGSYEVQTLDRIQIIIDRTDPEDS